MTSSFPSTLASTATTVAAPHQSCVIDELTSPPGGAFVNQNANDSICAVSLYNSGYSVKDATTAIQTCCGNETIIYYTNGCGLYCHTSTAGNVSDYSQLQSCLDDKLGTQFCESQVVHPGVASSSSTAATSPPTSTATTSATPSQGAAVKAADLVVTKAGGFVALLLATSFCFGFAAL